MELGKRREKLYNYILNSKIKKGQYDLHKKCHTKTTEEDESLLWLTVLEATVSRPSVGGPCVRQDIKLAAVADGAPHHGEGVKTEVEGGPGPANCFRTGSWNVERSLGSTFNRSHCHQ